MNIIIDGHSLNVLGGLERVVCDLANAMAERGHAVYLFVSQPLSAQPLYAIHPQVRCVLYTHHGRQRYLREFQQQILNCQPNICISPAGDRRHLPWCAALIGTGIPLVISEHNAPEIIENELWNARERRAVMAAADAIHCLRPSCAASLPLYLQAKVQVIPNAVTLPLVPQHSNGCTITSMGRLASDKQNTMLVDAFAKLADDFPEWTMNIWGAGPDKRNIASRIRHHALEHRVFLRGLTQTPQYCYAATDILCIPSRHEALPNVVLEAMTASIPAVGFASCPGVNEAIQDGVTGLLASEMTASSLAESLRTLMCNPQLCHDMGQRAQQVAQAYQPSRVYDLWEQLLQRTVAQSTEKTALQRLFSVQQSQQILTSKDQKSALSYDMAARETLQHCLQRPNLLVDDHQILPRWIFEFPWLKKALHPLYTFLRH